MKNSIVILFLLLLSQFGYAQGRTFKVTARPWVERTQKNCLGKSMIPVLLLNWMGSNLLVKYV